MPSLSTAQKTSIRLALTSLRGMLDCCEDCLEESDDADIQSDISGLLQLLDSGKIDWEDDDNAVKASTNRKGIHLNPKFGDDYRNTYQLPADYVLSDCPNGYFASFWTILEILLHEYYHYQNHSGVVGALKGGATIVFGWVFVAPGDYLSSLLGGKSTPYNLKEFLTYRATCNLLDNIYAIIDACCDAQDDVPEDDDLMAEPCDCVDCCNELLAALAEAIAREDPFPP